MRSTTKPNDEQIRDVKELINKVLELVKVVVKKVWAIIKEFNDRVEKHFENEAKLEQVMVKNKICNNHTYPYNKVNKMQSQLPRHRPHLTRIRNNI